MRKWASGTSAKRFPVEKTVLENVIFSTFPEVFPSMTKFDFCNHRNGRNGGCHVTEVEISKISRETLGLGAPHVEPEHRRKTSTHARYGPAGRQRGASKGKNRGSVASYTRGDHESRARRTRSNDARRALRRARRGSDPVTQLKRRVTGWSLTCRLVSRRSGRSSL